MSAAPFNAKCGHEDVGLDCIYEPQGQLSDNAVTETLFGSLKVERGLKNRLWK
jgi:hypothetical protein